MSIQVKHFQFLGKQIVQILVFQVEIVQFLVKKQIAENIGFSNLKKMCPNFGFTGRNCSVFGKKQIGKNIGFSN